MAVQRLFDVELAALGGTEEKCRTCGVKRSFKDVTTSNLNANMPSTNAQNSVKARLEDVAAQLHGVAQHHAKDESSNASEERKALSAEIEGFESGLRALPDTAAFKELRDVISAKISEKKKEITKAKPIGAQVDACSSSR